MWLLACAPLLLADEALYTPLLSAVLPDARAGTVGHRTGAALLDPAGQTVAGALRDGTHLTVTDGPQNAWVALARHPFATVPPLRTVHGPLGAVRNFIAAAGGHWTLGQPWQVLAGVRRVPPPAVPGLRRLAQPEDLDLIGPWLIAYARAALDPAPSPQAVLAAAHTHVERQELHLWEDGAGPVSCVLASLPAVTGVGLTGLYTPPAFWRRGYAHALGAALHNHLLDRGHAFTAFTVRPRGALARDIERLGGGAFEHRGEVVTARRTPSS